jgi:hypothetical protein
MSLPDHHPVLHVPGLKVVCEACGSLSIKAIDPVNADDSVAIYCRRCNAHRGTMADLRELARGATGEFEF